MSDLQKYNDMTNISVNKSNTVEGYMKINNQSSKSSMYENQLHAKLRSMNDKLQSWTF